MTLFDIKCQLDTEKLSDGSVVFNVTLTSDTGAVIRLTAISESDAFDLIEKISDAINEHTVNECRAF